MPSIWNIHCARWVIEDRELEIGVEEDFDWFALAFWPTSGPLVKTSGGEKSAIPISDYRYQMTAEVVFISVKSCVIDFGLRAINYAAILTFPLREPSSKKAICQKFAKSSRRLTLPAFRGWQACVSELQDNFGHRYSGQRSRRATNP